MTYDTRERSQYDGQPVECYRFVSGFTVWRFTSADEEITLPIGTFLPDAISRSQQEHSQEDGSGAIEIRVPRTSPIAAPFIAYLPDYSLNVTIYRAHRGAEDDPEQRFIGQITGARFIDSEAILRATPTSHSLKRRLPRLGYHQQCNWQLYGAGCLVDKASFSDPVIVTEVDGFDIVSNDFLLQASGWYDGGWIERVNGERRFVVAHVGNRVTLMNPFLTLPSLELVTAVAGCDRLAPTCSGKFNNLDNHLGFARFQTSNPHASRIA